MAQKYFNLFGGGPFGVVYEATGIDRWLVEERALSGELNPIEFDRREGKFPEPLGEFANGTGVDRLCAPRLREIIDSFRTSDDTYEWFDAIVTDHDGIRRPYYVMLFRESPDVLDVNASTFARDVDVLIKPVLSRQKIGHRTIFNIPGCEVATVVRNDLKTKIETAEITGVEFSPIPVR